LTYFFLQQGGRTGLNIEEEPITITLEVHGYYDRIEELMRSCQY
jgi:hypothetical protein